jgi:hypothetical protein
MPFLSSKKKPEVSKQDALAAKPIHVVSAEMRPTESGGVLEVSLASKGRGLGGWLFRMPAGSTKKFEFDPVGVFVWDQCDGKTSVQQIIRKLARRHNLNVREAEVATVQFLRTLSRKGLIGLEVKKAKGAAEE